MISNKSSEIHRCLLKRETKSRMCSAASTCIPCFVSLTRRFMTSVFRFFRTLLRDIPLHFFSPDAAHVRSRFRPRTICNFPLDMHQEFRDVLYPRSMLSHDCRREERRRAKINLGQSPFSFHEKETAAFPSFPFSARVSSFPMFEQQLNRNEGARYVKYVAFFLVFSYATRSTANYVGNDTLRETEIAQCSFE